MKVTESEGTVDEPAKTEDKAAKEFDADFKNRCHELLELTATGPFVAATLALRMTAPRTAKIVSTRFEANTHTKRDLLQEPQG